MQHPSKEPDYRKKRGHHDFLIGLSDIVGDYSQDKMKAHFEQHLESDLSDSLKSDLCDPIEKQFSHLEKLSQSE